MTKEPHELLETVEDETSFLKFVEALRQDRETEVAAQRTTGTDPFGRGPNGWENHTIESFLEAALSWAKSTGLGETQGLKDENPWKKFAVFLYCGKIYE
jgi:hypothetical protein